jgi:glycosyltransferase involved in cell wall biosynthesis
VDRHVKWPFGFLKRYRNVWFAPATINDPPWVLRLNVTVWPGGVGMVRQAPKWERRLFACIQDAWPDFCPDVIHAHTFVPGGTIAARLAGRFHRPFVVTTHGGDTRDFLPRPAGRNAILQLCRQAKAVICVGDVLKELLLQAGVCDANLQVLYNGMDLSKIYQGSNPLAERYRGKRVVLGVGNLTRAKGFDLLIEATAQLAGRYPDLQTVIVGGGRELPRLQALVRQFDVGDRVEICGFRAPLETMAYMDACEIFCLPSWLEGFGIVYLEAMAHGKPVIGVQGQGVERIVREHQTGLLVPPRDADAVARAIETLLGEPQRAQQMGHRGRQLVLQEFSWEKHAERLLTLYRDTLQQK